LVAGGEKARLLAGLSVVGWALDFDSLPMHEIFTEPGGPVRLPKLLGQYDRLVSCFAAGDARAQMRLAAACGAGEAAFLPIRPDESFQGHLLDLWCDLLGLQGDAGVPPAPDHVACGETSGNSKDADKMSATHAGETPAARMGKMPRPHTGGTPVPRTAWPVPKAWRTKARDSIKAMGLPDRPATVLHVGAGSPKKCWPLENFISLGWQLSRERPDEPVLFVLGPAEIERLEPPLIAELRKTFPVLESPPLETLAGVLADCRAYVGNDSGVSHLAAAVGAPCVAMFGPTNPAHFRPLGPSVRVIHAKSMAEIGVERVLDEVEAVERGA
jgi:hypothetical protein